mmetsp:Transcript_19028/g.41215  ORF Transcript_19028/g.41215 Transcript_19028/m.41215 type:complete len:416 (-) Transcript_19028:145-1392(-)
MTSNVHVGVPRNEWDSWESHFVHFHHFESMSTEKDHAVYSPKFSCCNHDWRVRMYPGGDKDSTDGNMAFYLGHCSGTEISAKYFFIIRDVSGKVIKEEDSETYDKFATATAEVEDIEDAWGWKNFVERAEIIDASNKILSHGTLTVEVRIKPDDDNCCMNFIPKNEFVQNMLQSFMDEETADILFEVKSKEEESASVLFYAHKLVLQLCAKGSTLASFCEDCDKSTPVQIPNIDPQVFHQMFYYVYGGLIAVDEWRDHAKDFIDAADRYGVKNLKIEAEAWYVKYLKITVDNVVEALVYADKKNCFLLKEAAMNFILKNAQEVLASDTFDSIPESKNITREIISVAAMNIAQGDDEEELDDPTQLSINELRAKLYAKGKEIDGPRKRLIDQLLEPEKKKLKTSEYDQSTEDEQSS